MVSGNERNEVDELVGDLREDEYAIMPTAKDETIAWVLWHISRIEDLTMNILVNGEKQIFNEDWQTRMNSPIRDTGNALSDNQIIQLSKSLRIQELLAYIIHSGFISGYQNRYGDNLKPPTNVYHRMTA